MFDRTAHLYDLAYAFKDSEGETRDLVEPIRARNPSAGSVLDGSRPVRRCGFVTVVARAAPHA